MDRPHPESVAAVSGESTATGQGASSTSRWLTEPSKARRTAPSPWSPTTRSPAFADAASSASTGEPAALTTSPTTPGCRRTHSANSVPHYAAVLVRHGVRAALHRPHRHRRRTGRVHHDHLAALPGGELEREPQRPAPGRGVVDTGHHRSTGRIVDDDPVADDHQRPRAGPGQPLGGGARQQPEEPATIRVADHDERRPVGDPRKHLRRVTRQDRGAHRDPGRLVAPLGEPFTASRVPCPTGSSAGPTGTRGPSGWPDGHRATCTSTSPHPSTAACRDAHQAARSDTPVSSTPTTTSPFNTGDHSLRLLVRRSRATRRRRPVAEPQRIARRAQGATARFRERVPVIRCRPRDRGIHRRRAGWADRRPRRWP